MITLQRALALAALVSTLSLGACGPGHFDNLGMLKYQLEDHRVPHVSDQFMDADIDRMVDYRSGVTVTNQALHGNSNAVALDAVLLAEAADRRVRHDDCQPGVETLLLGYLPVESGYPSGVLVCKDLKSPIVRRIITQTNYNPAGSFSDPAFEPVLVMYSSGAITYRDVSHREKLLMEKLRAMNKPDVQCPSWYPARRSTIAGSATKENPYGTKAWGCYFNPNDHIPSY